MFNKLIYAVNTIIKSGIWQPVKFHVDSRSWNEMYYFLSYFWIFVANINLESDKKKIITFSIQFKNERLTEILQTVRCHILRLY